MTTPKPDVIRWHSCADPRLRNSGDTVSKHHDRVADLCLSLAARIGHPLIGSDLLKAARHHDAAEAVLGDMPYPAKKRFPRLAAEYAAAEAIVLAEMGLGWNLTDREEAMLDLCDKADAWRWAHLHGATDTRDFQQARMVLIYKANKLGAVDWLEEVIDGRVVV